MAYISLPVTTDTNALVATAFTNIASKVPGWIPRDGNLDVLLLEEFALMASEATQTASGVQESIFKYFGQLVNIVPKTGINAEIYTTWNLLNPATPGGITYPAGTVAGFYYNGGAYQFELIQDLVIPAGSSAAYNVLMQAIDVGAAYNLYDIAGLNYLGTTMYLLNSDSILSYVGIEQTYAENSNLTVGVDAESDSAFLNRLTAELQLLAPRPITPHDYAEFSQNVTGVYRALSIDGYDPYANILSAADANFTNAASVPANWVAVGEGSTTLPTLAITGTSPSAALQVTAAAMPTVSLSTDVAQGNVTITLSVASALTAPFGLLLVGPNGSEATLVTAVSSFSTGTQQVTLAAPINHAYPHSTTTVKMLQGVKNLDTFDDTYNSGEVLYGNSAWYQAAAIVENGDDTTGTPIVMCVATYSDNQQRIYSSVAPEITSTSQLGLDYSTSKTVVANTPGTVGSGLTPGNNAYFFGQNVIQIDQYIVWANATSTKKHKVLYASINEVNFDLTYNGIESQYSDTSLYNFVPDSALASWGYTNGALSSWSLGSNFVALPGVGFVYNVAGAATAKSSYFNLGSQSLVGGLPSVAANKNYTFIAYVDTASSSAIYSGNGYTGIGSNSITISVVNGANSVLNSAVVPAAGGFVYVPFTISAGYFYDLQVQISFGSGVVLASGNIAVSQMSLLATGDTPMTNPPSVYQTGYFWQTGGNFTASAVFNAPKNVAITPIDATGTVCSPLIVNNLDYYLQSSREANFTVKTIQPNYVPVNVTWSAVAMPGYDPTVLTTEANAAIYAMINPGMWAGGDSTPPVWDGTRNVIQSHDIAGIIASVTGIGSISSVTMTQGTNVSAAVSGINSSGGTVTVVTTSNHGFATGQLVNISGTGTSLDANAVVITVTSSNSFTYSTSLGTISASQGTVVLTPLNSIPLLGPAPLPIANYVSGNVNLNPVDALVGVI